jgi:hypothetical protein
VQAVLVEEYPRTVKTALASSVLKAFEQELLNVPPAPFLPIVKVTPLARVLLPVPEKVKAF